MSITAQHSVDLHRAAQHGTPLPPAPGQHDWQVLKELWAHGRQRRAALKQRRSTG